MSSGILASSDFLFPGRFGSHMGKTLGVGPGLNTAWQIMKVDVQEKGGIVQVVLHKPSRVTLRRWRGLL